MKDTAHHQPPYHLIFLLLSDGNVAQAALGLPPIWPNVTIPNFQEQTAGLLIIADGRALSYNPIITQDVNRLEWEAHATESAWILGAPQLISPPPDSTWPNNRTVSFGIYVSEDTSLSFFLHISVLYLSPFCLVSKVQRSSNAGSHL